MKLIERVKNILLTPKTEWDVIETEETTPSAITTGYLLPLALIPAIATFIGMGLIGYDLFGVHVGSVGLGIKQALVSLISTLAGVYITAFIIDNLAPNFGSQKNFNQAFKLVSYSYTPMMVAGILLIFPKLSLLVMLAGIYGLYLLFIGLQPLMKTPEEKKTTFFVVSIICLIVVYAILGAILSAIFIGSSMMG